MAIDISSLFTQLKDITENNSSKQNIAENYMQFKIGKTYRVRLLLNPENPKQSIFTYDTHTFKSVVNGKDYRLVSRQLYKERDPIAEWCFAARNKNPRATEVKWRRNHKVNVYVIDDPVNPANNGTVKIISMGQKLHGKIKDAIESEDFGQRIFDLSKNGCDFVIKVTDQGGYNNYDSSSFSFPKDIGLNSEKIEAIYKKLHKIDDVKVKSYDEIKELFNTHFHGTEADSDAPAEKPAEKSTSLKPASMSTAKKESVEKAATSSLMDDPELQALLGDVDIGD